MTLFKGLQCMVPDRQFQSELSATSLHLRCYRYSYTPATITDPSKVRQSIIDSIHSVVSGKS